MIKLNRRIAAIKHSATLAADARASEMRAAGIDVMPLAAGEPDFDTPERIKEAARRALAQGCTHYTPVSGIPELKEAIRFKLKRDNDLDYQSNEILVSAGGKQAEANVINALFDEGDEVVIPTPAWVSFFAMVSLAGASPIPVRCSEEDGFLLDPDRLRRLITPRTKGIILVSPSNPTGAVYPATHLSELAKVLAEHDIWVMSDDVYEHIVYDGPVAHLFRIEPRLRQRGILFNSLSKAYAMTGWRLGFAAGPSEVISAAARLQSQNSGNPNSIAQFAAIEALTGAQDELTKMVDEFRARRELVVDRVRRIPGFHLPHKPQGAFYVFPSISALLGTKFGNKRISDGDTFAEAALNEAHVAIVGGNDFGAPEHVRLSYATSRENLNEAFDRLDRLVARLEH
jgi:aspartate aminotransferase